MFSKFAPLITIDNIVFSAVLAFFITYGIMRTADFFAANKKRQSEGEFDFDDAISRCYTLFPISNCRVQDFMLERGMMVRIVTSQNRIFEGKFLGANKDNMLCLMTKKFIIAHAMHNIDFIEKLD